MPRSRMTFTTPCLPMASPRTIRGADASAGSQVTAPGRLTKARTRPDERASTVTPPSGPLPSTCRVTCSSSLVKVARRSPASAARPKATAGTPNVWWRRTISRTASLAVATTTRAWPPSMRLRMIRSRDGWISSLTLSLYHRFPAIRQHACLVLEIPPLITRGRFFDLS